MNISEKIQQLRKSRGLSQEQLAEKLDVSRQAVSKWESGVSNPDSEKIVLISELFNVSTDYLLKEGIADVSCGTSVPCVKVLKKLYIIDVNKRKISGFDEFVIEMICTGKTEATLITGTGKSDVKVKVPVCVLSGITKGIFGISKHIKLGYYASFEDAEKELNEISNVSAEQTVYELKYAAKMEGVRIADDE